MSAAVRALPRLSSWFPNGLKHSLNGDLSAGALVYDGLFSHRVKTFQARVKADERWGNEGELKGL